ncbi:MAG: hypothetical protein LUG45_10865 [Clostridiales bacterium]|nr:hypothetical protein [Clostridiales bacterium]
MELQVDEEFSTQIPPLTDEEFEQLEENILSDGEIISPIITWNGFIVDGHNRYRILQEHPEIPYKTFEMEFPDRYAVLAWICHNQLGRRNLTEEQKKYLIGKQYNSEKASHGGERGAQRDAETGQFTSSSPRGNLRPREKTWERIAEENHVGKNYVLNAEHYAKGVDAADEIEPGIRQDILSGKITPTAKDVSEVADAEPEERPEMVRRLRMTKKEKYEELKRMREIGESLQTARKVTEESMLVSISALVDTMMSSCNRCFHEFPHLLDDPHYRAQLIEIMQKPKNYIMTIETGGSPL